MSTRNWHKLLCCSRLHLVYMLKCNAVFRFITTSDNENTHLHTIATDYENMSRYCVKIFSQASNSKLNSIYIFNSQVALGLNEIILLQSLSSAMWIILNLMGSRLNIKLFIVQCYQKEFAVDASLNLLVSKNNFLPLQRLFSISKKKKRPRRPLWD